MTLRRHLAVAIGAGALLSGCAWLDVEVPTPTDVPAAGLEGRTACPGSVPAVLTNLRGGSADALEELQATYASDPGFRAVVFDGAQPIVVVDAATLPDWQLRLGPLGLAVAPSCVDPELLAAVHRVVPVVAPADRTITAGYNALDDRIFVMGIDADTLIRALEEQAPGAGDAALDAIAEGTLGIDEQPIPPIR